eukprot:c10909_g1_i1.p1 GENE.c10909_g1_i1~~c10909_g1_i1.p1  ORF type:complete len:321 (+),score=51.76 c10909_g1_i1:40-1002(+)
MDVTELLASAKRRYKTTAVEKAFPVSIDLGNLCLFDPAPLARDSLAEVTRDNAQVIINALFGLPSESLERATVVRLPEPTIQLPRSKPVPKPKPPTRWQMFAKLKGIAPKSKSRMVQNEETGELRPRFGYKAASTERPWMIEHKKTADPFSDPFAEEADAKAKRRAVNRKKEMHNLRRAGALPARPIDQIAGEKPKKAVVRDLIAIQNQSTASYGRFNAKIDGELKDPRPAKKRKLNPVVDDSENDRQRRTLDRVLGKMGAPVANMERATNKYLAAQESRQALVGYNPDWKREKSNKGITRGGNFTGAKRGRGGRGAKRR